MFSERVTAELKVDIPTCVPVYDTYLPDPKPLKYIYISVPHIMYRNTHAFRVCDNEFAPAVEKGDFVLVDRAKTINDDEVAVCILNGDVNVGKVKKIDDKLWLVNNSGKIPFQNNQLAGIVVKILK